jgi:hypothetical protein
VWGLGVWGLRGLGNWCVKGFGAWGLGGSRTVACGSGAFDLGVSVGTGTSNLISNAMFGFSLCDSAAIFFKRFST